MPEDTPKQKPNRILQLDGLRGFAVLAVVINHFNEHWLAGGFVGVDIFFVLSGYVVTLSVLKRQVNNYKTGILEFYKRRFLRILPALILCITSTTILSALFIPRSWLSRSLESTGIWSIVGGSNIAQIITNDGYFAPSSEYNPFTHTWSLGIEEQFYLLIPIFLFLLSRRSAALIVAVLSTASIALAISWAGNQQALAFYSLFSRFWELGLGVLIAIFASSNQSKMLLSNKSGHQVISIQFALSLSGLLAVLYSVIFNGSNVLTPWPGSVLPAMGTSLIIISTIINEKTKTAKSSLSDRFLLNPVLFWFGFISYALYLWHWPVIVLMKWTIGLDTIPHFIAGALVSLGLACLSTYYVEIPFSKLSKVNTSRVVCIGILSALASTFGVSQIFHKRDLITFSTVNKNRHDWYAEAPLRNGANKDKKTIFVLGNSHALAYSPLLHDLHLKQGWNTRIFPMGHCAVGSVMRPVEDWAACESSIETTIQKIFNEAKPGDIVWFASLRMYRYVDQGDNSIEDIPTYVSTEDFRSHLERGYEEISTLIPRFEKAGLKTLIDRPKPVFKTQPFRCVDWFNASNNICKPGFEIQKSEFIATSTGVNEKIDLLKNRFSSLIVWDPATILCSSESCSAMKGDKPLFFDADHLSRYGNTVLVGSLEEVLQPSLHQ